MTDPKKKFYSDILQAISLIEEFVSDTKNYQQYVSSAITKSAVERQLAIIGEAVTSLNKIDPGGLLNAQQIISFRNRLIHAYDSIDDSIVWAIVKTHLVALKNEILGKV